MTYAMLLQILVEAQERVREYAAKDAGVVARSQETVDLVMQRLQSEGLTVADLRRLAK